MSVTFDGGASEVRFRAVPDTDPLEAERDASVPASEARAGGWWNMSVSDAGVQIVALGKSAMSGLGNCARRVYNYLSGVWMLTRSYLSPYAASRPSGKTVLAAWWLLLKRFLFTAFVCLALYIAAAELASSARRYMRSGALASYETLMSRCERALDRDPSACGAYVAESGVSSGNRLMCLWTDKSHTELVSFMNPAMSLTGPTTYSVTERQVGCKSAESVTRRRNGQVTVYFDSISEPGTQAAQKLEDLFLSFCAQHVVEFPVGTPCG